MKLEVSRRADADIQGIADYTVAHWGEDQAERYVGGLWREMESLARRGANGRPIDNLSMAARRSRFGSHVIIFVHDGDDFVVARVLHQAMDMVKHLR